MQQQPGIERPGHTGYNPPPFSRSARPGLGNAVPFKEYSQAQQKILEVDHLSKGSASTLLSTRIQHICRLIFIGTPVLYLMLFIESATERFALHYMCT